MAATVLLVHGMGRHPSNGWDASWRESIVENLRQYAPYSEKSAAEVEAQDLHFHAVGYDAVFEQGFRSRWNGLAGALADAALPLGMRRVLEVLQSDDDPREVDVFWHYLLDPLLWVSLGQARERVIASVAEELAKGAMGAQQRGERVHIIAHSLGTSVVHDTLLAMTDRPDGAFDPDRSGLRWDSLTQVANVSRLLCAIRSPSAVLPVEAFKPHRSRVRPGAGGLVRRFLDARHRLDPFTFPRTFQPDWSRFGGHTFRVLQRFDSPKGVHDFETHFDCPGVHLPCLRGITGRGTLGKSAEVEGAWRRYDLLYGRDVSLPLESLRLRLEPSTERELGIVDLADYLRRAAQVVFA